MLNDWSISHDLIGDSDKVDVQINDISYRVDQNYAMILHCLLLICDKLEETNEEIDSMRDSMVDMCSDLTNSIGCIVEKMP